VKLLSAIGISFLILSLMMPAVLSYSYGPDVKWVMYSILTFALGIVLIILSAIRLKQKMEYDLYKKQRLDS